MTVPSWRDWLFALNVLLAALLAIGIALWVDLPRPYWAVSTVVITSQPLAGATRAKAAYRVYGTLIGAVAAVILVPNQVNAPELLSLAIALWVGFCLYISLLDRTPKSYVMMLAGYTAAFVGFPDVGDPGSIFDVAVARAEEITLGILCASIVGSTVLPRSVAPALRCRLDKWFGDAFRWTKAVLKLSREGDSQPLRIRLACDAISFDALVTPLKPVWRRASHRRTCDPPAAYVDGPARSGRDRRSSGRIEPRWRLFEGNPGSCWRDRCGN
jgi:uncharacterized membrane protein YccC